LFAFLFKELPVHTFNRVLIVSPHPDDEVLGCGGFIQKLLDKNKTVYVLMATRGEASLNNAPVDKETLISKRKELLTHAANILGIPVKNYITLDWDDGQLTKYINDETKHREFISIIEKIRPTELFLTHPAEGSRDHAALTQLSLNALNKSNLEINMFFYCVWVWFDIFFFKSLLLTRKNCFCISMRKKERAAKKDAIDAYLDPSTPDGRPYSGVQPYLLRYAANRKREIFVRANPAVLFSTERADF
jgi:hypothetical protein